MKTPLLISLSLTTACAFIGSYFMELTADNIEQYLSVALVVFADGFFGVWGGIKKEGFITNKTIKVLKTFGFWVVMLFLLILLWHGWTVQILFYLKSGWDILKVKKKNTLGQQQPDFTL